jgi:hypothetical protein
MAAPIPLHVAGMFQERSKSTLRSSIYGVTAKTGHGKTALLICGSIAVMKRNDESGSLISKVLGCEVERGRVACITKENLTISA